MLKGKGMTLYIGTCINTGSTVNIYGKQGLMDAGYTPSGVIRCCNGERKTHKGMTWKKVKSTELN